VLIPKLVVGKQLNTHAQPYELLRTVFNMRDRLVHYKTRIKQLCDINDEDRVTEKNACDAIQSVGEVIRELRSLDPTFSIEWLKIIPREAWALDHSSGELK
jgi:hypothetical protein